jgi:crotonobetainyl-CoA:carnitine CoA-transferase CaiB-like acyl-CoA transferase
VNSLDGQRILMLETSTDSALPRLLASLGASVVGVDRAQLAREISGASMLIDRVGLAALEEIGWARSRVEAANPSIVQVSITPFGSHGPRARWLGSELVCSAMGGVLGVTGTPDRPPVKEALDACAYHADMVAAAGALAAHYERGASGMGQHVDISIQEVAFSRNVNGVLVWQFDRRKLQRVGGALNYGRATVRCIWRLADGWCFHTLMTGRLGAPANEALSAWIDAAGLRNPLRGTDWLRYDRSTLPAAVRADWEEAIDAFFRTRTKAEIASEGRRRGINAAPLHEPADVLTDPHLQARGFWREIAGMRVPDRFVRIVEGEHVRVGAGEQARIAGGEGAASRKARDVPDTPNISDTPNIPDIPSRGGPLAGVRVLDFSWALVGSITTKTLGDLGADVVKVESRTRPCLSRIDVQVSASKPGQFDDKPWFAHLNTSKRSLALDLKRPEAAEVLGPLIQWADVVVENFSPGTLARLGLDFERLQHLHPGLVMVSGSVYGQTGPLAKEWGVDGTGGALSGRTFLTGWSDRDPVIPGAVPYGDVIVPYVMAAVTSAALEQRRRSGVGCHIDASMYEICVQQMYDALVQCQRGEVPHRMGNAEGRVFHQGVYPVAGVDRWIAITCATPDEWARLRELGGVVRDADPTACDPHIAEWTRQCSGSEIVARLQNAGIAAGEVQDIEDLVERDPQIAARGSLMPLDHRLLGRFGHVRTPLTFSRSVMSVLRAPGMGEHSRQIAGELAGLAAERIDALEQLGVFR